MSAAIKFNMASPPVSPLEYDVSMVLGTMQVPRTRSLSTSVVPKFPDLSHRDRDRELQRTVSESNKTPPSIVSGSVPKKSPGSSIQVSPGVVNTSGGSIAQTDVFAAEPPQGIF